MGFFIIFLLVAPPVLFIISLNLILSFNTFSNNQPLPPGKTGILSYVGETLELGSMGKKGTPEIFFMDRMKKFSNQVFKTSLIGQKTAVFCGVAGNKFLFANEDKLMGRSWPNGTRKLFPHSGETISDLRETSIKFRRNLYGTFNPDAMQICVGIIDSLTNEHLKNHWEDNEITVVPLLKQFSFTVACKLFLNINADQQNSIKMDDFTKKFETFFAAVFSLPVNIPGTALNRGIKITNFIRGEFLNIIRQKRIDPQVTSVDYLSSSLKSRDEKGKLMSELEISDMLLATILGSRDSTSSAITSTIKYLADYPLVYDQVLKEQRSIAREKQEGELLNMKDLQKMKYTWNVVCEVLRLFPPVQGNFREALHDFTHSNFFIPKGWKFCSYSGVPIPHTDPKYFPEPEKFDPSRFEGNGPVRYAYLPLGGGPHICPGKDIAQMIILIFINNVVAKFRWETLFPDEKIVSSPIPFPEKGLPVRLFPPLTCWIQWRIERESVDALTPAQFQYIGYKY